MAGLGHFRRPARVLQWSGEPQRPDMRSLLRHVRVAPTPDLAHHSRYAYVRRIAPKGILTGSRPIMNRLKDLLAEPPGVTPTPGKYVCPGCFGDDALRDVVRAHAKSKVCSYCGKRSTKAIAASLDNVVEHIFDCLSARYEDAANGVGWEGGYVGADTFDTFDLVEETVDFGDAATEELYRDVLNALPCQIWSRIDPYGPLERDVMKWSWRDFSKTVKHVRRYFFQDHLETADRRGENFSPAELLASVAQGCEEYGLVETLKAGQRFFRCRARKKGKKFTDPQDLGPPPAAVASQSRMSPAGIPMFYGALDRKTAAVETLTEPGPHAMAEFRTTRPIRVLDLIKPPHVSIFDPIRGRLDEWAAFMRAFINEFQRPVAHDGEQHYEYVPTQVVTEYFRSALGATGALDGILYSSVKNPAGLCIVLFADRNDVDPKPDPSRAPFGPHLLKMGKVTNTDGAPRRTHRTGPSGCPQRVKIRKARNEHMFSVLVPIAHMCRGNNATNATAIAVPSVR